RMHMKTYSESSPYPLSSQNRRIAPARERLQSEALVWAWILTVLPLTALITVVQAVIAWQNGRILGSIEMQGVFLCIVLACLVVEMRAATPAAAAVGGVICVTMTMVTSLMYTRLTQTLLPPLITLFLLTFAATSIGHTRKLKLGLAESRHGRAVNQIIANLGASSLLALMHQVTAVAPPACIAMLAEATADTLASELGPVLPGRTLLLTSLRRVPRGTDGGVSLGGTLCGLAGAAIVVTIGIRSLDLGMREAQCAFGGAIAGFFADSLLGATLERYGILGNDMVNFLSTVVAGVVAIGIGLHLNL
ncbi:MAG TPA: DUF92 domain-containing protein, partial [Acidobacteriaceae bacterium]